MCQLVALLRTSGAQSIAIAGLSFQAGGKDMTAKAVSVTVNSRV
jgi:hypothetical protein